MAGRPLTRGRRAAAQAATTRHAFDAATRSAAVARAAEIGDRAAAAEIGAAPATIRSWRKRQANVEPPPSEPITSTGGDDRADALLRRADEARTAEARALRKTDKLLSAGLAADARAASAVAKDAGDRSARLEQAAAAQREHELRVQAAETVVADWHVHVAGQLDRVFFESVGLGWGPAHEALLAALVQAFADGERDGMKVSATIPKAEADAAREAIDGTLRRRYRAELRGELEGDPEDDGDEAPEDVAEGDSVGETSTAAEAPLEAPTRTNYDDLNPVGGGVPSSCDVAKADSETPDDDPPSEPSDMPDFESLPLDWQRRYALNNPLGRYEWREELRRRERARRERENAPRRSCRQPSFQHPGLARPGEGRP